MTSHDPHASHHPAEIAALALCGIVIATVLALMTFTSCVNGQMAPATATAPGVMNSASLVRVLVGMISSGMGIFL